MADTTGVSMLKYKKVLGPYLVSTGKNKGRKFVKIIYEDGHTGSKTYAHYLWEQTYGEIPTGMTIDHIDEDKSNDALDNLQLLSRTDNSRKGNATRPSESLTTFICPVCLKSAIKKSRDVRHNRNRGCSGPYCGRVCARKAQLEAGAKSG